MACAFSRIKDLVDVEGMRDNMLVGYGLVVGLNGTGDSPQECALHPAEPDTMLERLGVNTRGQTMQTKNVAAVMVTANLPAFAAQGTRIDVSVSALGDAKSLQGGTLLVTPLFGADGEIYSLAQGPVSIGGFAARAQARQRDARRADGRTHLQRRHRRTRNRFPLAGQTIAPVAAQSGSDDGDAHRGGHQRLSRQQRGDGRPIPATVQSGVPAGYTAVSMGF